MLVATTILTQASDVSSMYVAIIHGTIVSHSLGHLCFLRFIYTIPKIIHHFLIYIYIPGYEEDEVNLISLPYRSLFNQITSINYYPQ